MKITLTLFFVMTTVLVLLFSSNAIAKKRCKPFLEKLHKIQATQRNGYSLKRGQSLRAKEDKARDKWWACENSSKAKFKALYSKKKSKKKKLSSQHKKSKKRNKSNKDIKLTPAKVALANASHSQYSTVVVKSKFKGEKHIAWLAYYQKPSQCKQPKKMSVFAFCHEDKRKQQSQFDINYQTQTQTQTQHQVQK